MSRLYTRKTEKAKWTAEQLQAAILAINSGRKIRDVGRSFGIAESTLRGRLKNQDYGKSKLGRIPIFSYEVEK
jgi:transposase-like protein